MVAPSTLDDETYLEFVQALRAMAVGSLEQAATRAVRERLRFPEPAVASTENRKVIDSCATVGIRNRMLRSSQEMLWRGVARTYDRNREPLRAALRESSIDDSRLRLQPNFEYPSYLIDYHLQEGGYHGDELAGYVYHFGTKIFWVGYNDRDQAKEAIVEGVAAPADGVVHRLIDLGCSVGQSTTAFKKRFPDAEVWGVDVAEPVVRYAHRRAMRMGIDIRFAQEAAEDLSFPDDSVDLVFASLLFHEVPVPVGQAIVRQVARVLRPGGLLVINDINPDLLKGDEWDEYNRWWDTTQNAEPYEYEFLRSDFVSCLEAAFSHVEFEGSGHNGRWVAVR
jgi:SAM-dependent methyltransferase